MTDRDLVLIELRRRRDEAARIGDNAEALILNDRIRLVRSGKMSPFVAKIMRQFDSALARRRAYGPPSTQ